MRDADRLVFQLADLQQKVISLDTELQETRQKLADSEKEQEDLLVFLDEVSAKRKRDKERLKAAGQEVSDEEGGENENEEDE